MNSAGEAYYTIGPVWKNYMTKIADRLEPTVWPRPEEIKEMAISKASGKLPSDITPSDMIKTEVFASFAIPTLIDDSYAKVRIETITNRLANEFSPANVVEEKVYRFYSEDWTNWQSFIDTWALDQKFEVPPTEYADDIHNAITAANLPSITIVGPPSLSSVPKDNRFVDISVDVGSMGNGLEDIEFLMNGMTQYHSAESPYSGKVRIPMTATEGTILEITAKIIDRFGYTGESNISLRVGDEPAEIEPEPEVDPSAEVPTIPVE
jgi:hypothetical protein